MNESVLEIGDVIRIDRPGYKHVGVYVGTRWFDRRDVVHNRKGGGVELTTLAGFSGGSEIFIHQKATGDYRQRQDVAKRAMQLLGTKYDLLTFNCEHAANLAQRGKAESPQLFGYALLALIVVGGLALASSSKKA